MTGQAVSSEDPRQEFITVPVPAFEDPFMQVYCGMRHLLRCRYASDDDRRRAVMMLFVEFGGRQIFVEGDGLAGPGEEQ